MRQTYPSAEQFKKLIALFEARERPELTEGLEELVGRFNREKTLAIDDIRPFLAKCDLALGTDESNIRKSAAFQWFDKQRGLEEAFNSMTRARKRRSRMSAARTYQQAYEAQLLSYLTPPSLEQVIAEIGPEDFSRLSDDDQEQRITYRQSFKWRADRLEYELTRYRDRRPFPLLCPIAIAFNDYFHADRPAELRALKAALEAITERGEQTMRLMLKAGERHAKYTEDFEAARVGMMRNARRLDRHYFALTREFQAAQRKDAIAKERMLVHDLHYGLRRVGWRPGAAALADFLTCDGVVNRLDTRTIERHLAQWKMD